MNFAHNFGMDPKEIAVRQKLQGQPYLLNRERETVQGYGRLDARAWAMVSEDDLFGSHGHAGLADKDAVTGRPVAGAPQHSKPNTTP